MTYMVEITRPCFPAKGPAIVMHKASGFSRDSLSPDMTCVFQVDGVKTKEQALACCLERLAGMNTTVRQVF